MMTELIHQPVLVEVVLQYLQPSSSETYLDLTAGYGGHAQAVANKIGPSRMVLVDRDALAAAHLRKQFKAARVLQGDFYSAAKMLLAEGLRANMILMDLGVSSAQLDNPDRGFSFRGNGPLDMRMDQSASLTAEDIVNHYSRTELADILYLYGGERRSRQIAQAIVRQRPISGTQQLAKIVASRFHSYQRTHPATRTFQALRIVVNDELGQLEATLPLLTELLQPNGRLVVISFHSLEDRLVKRFLKSERQLTALNKKVIKGNQNDSNPRARSAKLRAASKNKNQKEVSDGNQNQSSGQ